MLRLPTFCAVLLLLGMLLLGSRVMTAPAAPSKPLSSNASSSKPLLSQLSKDVPTTAGQLTILDAKGQPAGLCPLQHTDVQADVAGFVARVTVQQKFHNPATGPIEAIYTFPLPEDAAVDDMTMIIGARRIKGQIKKREEARQIYEAAKANGQAAALLDEERPNIFTQAVANIMPGEDVIVSISYVNLLKYDEGRYEWAFPTVVGPRFTPTGGYSVPGQRGAPSDPAKTPPGTNAVVNDADKITPPITPPGTRAGHDISLSLNIDAGVPIGDISSPLHPISVQRLGTNRAKVRLRDEATLPNKDFILRFGVAGEQLQTGVIAYAPSGGDGYFTLTLQPPVAPPATDIAPKEMVFVIDQTGSQMGWPIEKAKETMRYAIDHLNPGDTFQLLGFNTDVYPCFEKPVPATPENIAKAQDYLKPLQGGGGTDILKAADYSLKMPDDPARPRIICFMTDGYVGNEGQILEYVDKNRGRARMFPFGVGNSVNRYLIDGMAREGRGAAEYVTLQEPGDAAAQKFYRRIANPLLLDISVDWGDLPVQDVYPKHIPDVFTSGPIILKGRYTRPAEGDIIVHGLLHGQPWQRKIHVVLPAVQKDGGEAMPSVWAREKMADLEAQGRGADVKDQITALALEYKLMSPYTSFVAVEERIVNVGGQQRTLDVPVEMPEGVAYGGIFGGENRATVNGYVSLGKSFRASGGRGGFGGGGGFGSSGVVQAQAPPIVPSTSPAASAGGAATAAAPRTSFSIGQGLAYDDVSGSAAPANRDVAEGTEAGQKRLAAMKPEERLTLLRSVKLDKPLQGLADLVQKEGTNGTLHKAGMPNVDAGKVTVQIWLNTLPPDGMAKLRALGFDLAATLRPNKLLLGTIPVARLDEVLALPFVRFVEPPKFK